MAVYSAREIYRFARMAGFSPDQAVTMTAIALAESGGDSRAHNSSSEDSRGLWQINVAAHGDWAERLDLYDPLENAKAAYRIAGGGADISPWTTTHGSTSAPYLVHQGEAQAAALASGDPAGLGVWTGTPGYGQPVAAGDATGGAGPGEPTGSSPLQTFLDLALAQSGDEYVFGIETGPGELDPDTFDCSELVQWAAGRAGVELPDGSWLQYLELQRQGASVSVEEALHTPGALLFAFSEPPTEGGGRPSSAHVAISLGDGRTIEARDPSSGVGSWEAGDRFQYAAVIPGISDGSAGQAASVAAFAGTAVATDTDRDGVTDALEAQLGLTATAVDSDHDNLSDGYELLQLHTDPRAGDSDHDRVLDSLELALGSSPLDPDSDQDGQVDGAGYHEGDRTDTDRDGVSDPLERILGADPASADSDRDGFTDSAEYRSSYDLTDAKSNPLVAVEVDPTADGALPAPSLPGTATAAAPVPEPDPNSWGLDDLGTP